jgi:hypothetical protein
VLPGHLSPRAELNRVPTRTSVLPGYLSPVGGGESAIADLGVEFFRLDFEVWLAARSVPSQRGGFPGLSLLRCTWGFPGLSMLRSA